MIARGLAGMPAGPVWISLADCRGRSRIGIESQDHQYWCAPRCPIGQAGGGCSVTPEPGHRGARDSGAIIARTGDDGNRHHAGNSAPVFPAVELGQIIGAHEPDEAAAGIAQQQPAQGLRGVAGAELALDRGDADRGAAGLGLGRGEAGGKRRHARFGLERVSGGDQPPDLVQPQCPQRREADSPVRAMGGVERAAEEAGFRAGADQGLDLRAESGRCRGPATCRW